MYNPSVSICVSCALCGHLSVSIPVSLCMCVSVFSACAPGPLSVYFRSEVLPPAPWM